MEKIEDIIKKRLSKLDKSKLKEPSKEKNILLQVMLQEIMLTYAADIQLQLAKKEIDLQSNYPSDLISSLKIVADLYLKFREGSV